MQLVTTVKELRNIVREYKKQGLTVGLVPTMGALHAGHQSLIEVAKKNCDKVVVSVFVNPIQFGENEDFDKYPRDLKKDMACCESIGADIVFHPDVEEMYPDYNPQLSFKENLKIKEQNYIVKVPEKYTNKLCGKTRKGHFDGVCSVVLKLFNIVTPDKAFFGQKDIQQLIIIRKMCENLNLDIEICPCPIVREKSGLALSSRNSYLSDAEKEKAATINKMLQNIVRLVKEGNISKKNIFENSIKLLDKDIEVEYLECCDLNTLDYSEKIVHNSFIAVAVKIGPVRLIDNVVL